jgi:hypothetical protein
VHIFQMNHFFWDGGSTKEAIDVSALSRLTH